MRSFLKNIFFKLGVDGPIFYTSSSRIIQAAGGILTAFLIASFLTKEEQGFYYTFHSVLAIQIFFELGLGGIITQFVAHEMAFLSETSSSNIEGRPESLSRLSSLMHFCIKWYSILALILFVSLLIAGLFFFTKYGDNNNYISWKGPWIIITVATSLNFLVSPWMAVLQGMNKVKEMAKMAFIKQLFVMFITWLSLINGAKLYVAAINSVSGFVVLTILYSRTNYPRLLYNVVKHRVVEKVIYWREIFPFQWKIALSWISGYFIFQIFNPVIFAFDGAAAAGQMGMTLVVLNSILSLVVSWTSTKIPAWSNLIAKKDYFKLDRSLNEVLRSSTIVSLICILFFLIFLVVIRYLNLSIADRFLPLWLCAVLLSTVPLNNIINSWATYLRCHKKEPFLIQAIVTGLFCAVTTILTAKFFGVKGVVLGYLSVVIIISFPLSYMIFSRNKKLYHG